ncbi:septum formation initiator family protein [Alicyclobacillus sendaiensis]|uniref:Septum formation initiator family protein n=1 Tax=Alicyclobacillus sendaiensis PA2 TaxID=3029425 RepID=A0ABT6XY57_ALISE|nr:septum formation initiator family protein [Alicyclobacillus sendaiensis]MDI9260022.1 septum formation initiator family protein [Alicyclobacillus sendaiensis PA2]
MSAVQQELRTRREAWGHTTPRRERDARQEERRAARRRLWNRVSFALCCIVSFGAVWWVAAKGAEVYVLNDEHAKLEAAIAAQQAVNANLQMQVSELEQPAHILNVAINQLHMVYKNPVMIPTQGNGE